MTKNALWLRIDPQRAAESLREAAGKLEAAGGEAVLDLAGVTRIDTQAAGALEELAGKAGAGGGKVALHGVNVDVYRVLKLMKLTAGFEFVE